MIRRDRYLENPDGPLLRTLISSSTFPLPGEVGLPRFVYDLSEALSRHCQVTALVPDAPGAPRHSRMGSVEVRRFTYFRPRRWQRLAYGHGMRASLRDWTGKLQVAPFLAAQILGTHRQVRHHRIQVVNSHWMVPQGLSSAVVRGSIPHLVHVLSVHAADIYLLQKVPFGGALARYIVDRTDFVFADGSDVRDHLDRLLGRPSGAVLQPMGAHVVKLRQGPVPSPEEQPFDGGYLLFVGRFTEKKGIGHLLSAMPRILQHHPRLGLILIGYGALEQQLRRQAQRLGLDGAVRFIGRRPHSDVGRFLRGCRVAVVPSVIDRNGETDGMPTVVVEAMAAGTRVVGSAVDGIPDVVRDGDNGWLSRAGDPEDLADKILTALEDPPSSPILGNAEETSRQLDWSHVAARYAAVFRSLVDRRPASSRQGLHDSPLRPEGRA